MSGNNPGMVAASHSSCNRVVGVEVASTIFSSMLVTEILMSVFTPIPPKSTMQFSGNRLRPGGRRLRSRLEHLECVLPQGIADALVGTVHIVVAADVASRTHRSAQLVCQSSN